MPSKKIPYCVRQGDVLLVDAAYRGGMPDTAKPVKDEARGIVLMRGEVTGHAHVLSPERARYFSADAERYIRLLENLVPIEHEEHGDALIDRAALVNPQDGRLQQAFQVEDFGEEVRRVAD